MCILLVSPLILNYQNKTSLTSCFNFKSSSYLLSLSISFFSLRTCLCRYQGWLVRRIHCLLFVSGCKVSWRPAGNRLEGICQSHRYLRGKRNGEEDVAPGASGKLISDSQRYRK